MAGTVRKLSQGPRRKNLATALEADLKVLDGALNGREAYVALARHLVAELAQADGGRTAASLSGELRMILDRLHSVPEAPDLTSLDDIIGALGAPTSGSPQ